MYVELKPRTVKDLPATPSGKLLRERGRDLIEAGEKLGASGLRVFGSVARGEDDLGSDIDILVDLSPSVGLVGLGRLQDAFEAILGREVDVVPASGLKAGVRDGVLGEAIPLG